MIAHNPLHGSGRAALPHPALALGDDAKRIEGIGMTDAGRWKPPVDVASHPLPRQMMRSDCGACRARHQSRPMAARKAPMRSAVHGHAVVPHVARDDRAQIGCPAAGMGSCMRRRSSALTALQLRLPPLAHRLPQHRELPLPRLPAAVREAQKVEGLRLPVAPRSPVLAPQSGRTRSAASCRDAAPARTARTARAARLRNCSASSRCSNPTTKSSA